MSSNGYRARGYEARAPDTLRIRRSALDAARADTRGRVAAEACGLLIGRDGPECRDVLSAVPVENAWGEGARARYLIPAAELRRAETTAARDGLAVVGTYHAHRDGGAEPSAFDREHAWPWYTYLIIPCGEGGHPRAWYLEEDRSGFREEKLVITEDE